jgi:hypothetical protein
MGLPFNLLPLNQPKGWYGKECHQVLDTDIFSTRYFPYKKVLAHMLLAGGGCYLSD